MQLIKEGKAVPLMLGKERTMGVVMKEGQHQIALN